MKERMKMPNKQFYFTTPFTVTEKDADTESESNTLKISGYASTVDKDRDGDVIESKAWSDPNALKNYLNNPIILAYHDHKQPIGKMINHSIDAKGLHIEAEISKAAGGVYQLVKEGILQTFSVGFMVKDAEWDKADDVFRIKEVELFETSIVSIPANASAGFSVSKSFSSEDEYKVFKQQFETIKKEDDHMSKDIGKTNEPAAPVAAPSEPSLSALDVATIVAKSIQDNETRKENEKAEKAASAAAVSGAVTEATDRLEADMSAKLAISAKSEEALAATIADLTSQIGEQGVRLKAAQDSKMRYNNTGYSATQEKEMDDAVLLSKIVNMPISKTKFGQNIVEKVNPTGTGSNVPNDFDWETTFSTNIYEDLRAELKLEPFFQHIVMPTSTYRFPVNPEAGAADWVDPTDLKSSVTSPALGTNPLDASGVAIDQTLQEITMISKKLATKTHVGYEEEEDAILPILPLIRDSILRRMAEATDTSILMGLSSGYTEAASGIKGLFDFSPAGIDITAATAAGKITAAELMANRASLGRHGLDASKLAHFVSMEQFYNLMDDPLFLTMDKVGEKATILTGQIGVVGGVPVIVTEAFPAAALNAECAATVYLPNFLIGEQRGLRVESDKRIESQSNLIVATRRFDFASLEGTKACQFMTYAAA
jgi:HK97 family phage prohead protease/HK97 family phage major capsid protein